LGIVVIAIIWPDDIDPGCDPAGARWESTWEDTMTNFGSHCFRVDTTWYYSYSHATYYVVFIADSGKVTFRLSGDSLDVDYEGSVTAAARTFFEYYRRFVNSNYDIKPKGLEK
jgi:hypothetical protein